MMTRPGRVGAGLWHGQAYPGKFRPAQQGRRSVGSPADGDAPVGAGRRYDEEEKIAALQVVQSQDG